MSYYAPPDDGSVVGVAKKRFERNVSGGQEFANSVGRSSSVSPRRSERTLVGANVSRQLSNPGTNIKRTPAFRGDKPSRTRNLHSPTKERHVSIVDRNVRIFEEKPRYGKTCDERQTRERLFGIVPRTRCDSRETTDTTRYSVRTTVISRQKNISPIYQCDGGHDDDEKATETPDSSSREQRSYSFFKNGAEYTRVKKPSFGKGEKAEEDEAKRRRRIGNGDDGTDDEDDDEEGDGEEGDGEDGENEGKMESVTRHKLDIGKSWCIARGSNDTLKAALEAPLPSGPPPKKPPRTFAHVRRETAEGGRESSSGSSEPIGRKESRDSKSMLEKLERVLIQHRAALGTKVISPRRVELARARNDNYDDNCDAERRLDSGRSRLSRTLEDSKKSARRRDSRDRKHSTFDCLPSLNCASSENNGVRLRQPDFKSYFTDDCESKRALSRSDNSIEISANDLAVNTANLRSRKRISTSPPQPPPTTILTDDKFDTLSALLDGRENKREPRASEERVYAEPFAFDKNTGTDITGYGICTNQEGNYLSRSLRDENLLALRFGTGGDQSSPLRRKEPLKPELHYMCTSIETRVYEDNNNHLTENLFPTSRTHQRTNDVIKNESRYLDGHGEKFEPDKYDKIKVEDLLNRAFGKSTTMTEIPSDSNASSDTDSLASSSASISDELTSFNEKLRLFKSWEKASRPSKDELRRSLTEKRKNYVRRVSSKYTERRESDTSALLDGRKKLFQVCLLVELNLSTREPYVKDKYPAYAKSPAWIENFCFPDATDWRPPTPPVAAATTTHSTQNQFYSLTLMDERGNRRYGYCCRVRPEDGPILPLVYCLITEHRASGFYRKVLLELESRHGLPDKQRTSFIKELYNSPMPKPGDSLRLTGYDDDDYDDDDDVVDGNPESFSFSSLADKDRQGNNNNNNNNSIISKLSDYPTDKNGVWRVGVGRARHAFGNNSSGSTNDNTPESVIVRSCDARLEEKDMSQLFDAVSDKVLVVLFGSLLLERKVVLLCDKLSKLSSCIEALQSLLYPFSWPHTFIPVLPDIPGLSEILEAPLPFVIGVFKSRNLANSEVASVKEGIVVDLDTSKIVCAMGDESSILPPRLQKKIRSALRLVAANTKSGDGIRNFLVSEAFLRAFVETCSHYDRHIVTQQDGRVIFQKESFVKALPSKTEQYFLEWFVETTMFATFVRDCIERVERPTEIRGRDDMKLFDQRVAEYREGFEKKARKECASRKKTLGDRLKDLANFHG